MDNIAKLMKELSTDEEIMEKHKGYPPGHIGREAIRVREAMKKYPFGTETHKFLLIAQAGLSYSKDPFMYGSPLMMALVYGEQADEFRNRHKNQDSEDYSLQNDQDR